MYLPASFRETRRAHLHALIQAHPLGLLISHGAQGLQVSPLPFLLYPDEGEHGVLRAHMARANPHWRDLIPPVSCLVVFQGPQGYVTPSWYPSKARSPKTVPTWNYAVVQVTGQPVLIEEDAWLQRQLHDLTAVHEGRRPQPWQVSEAPADYLATQRRALVGIELPIRQLDGKFKLSQNRTAEDRGGVLSGLSRATDPHADPALAHLMTRSEG